MTVNKNAVPNDPRPPAISRRTSNRYAGRHHAGFKEAEAEQMSNWIADILDHMGDESTVDRVRGEVAVLCDDSPCMREIAPPHGAAVLGRHHVLPFLRPYGD